MVQTKFSVSLVSFLILITSFAASADGLGGFQRIRGADCSVIKGTDVIGSVVAQVNEDSKARVFFYKGARNAINPSVGQVAAGTGSAYSMIGFPVASSETIVISLDQKLASIIKLPRLVLSAKIKNPNPDIPANGYFANPFTEDDDIELRCFMAYTSTQQNLATINADHLQRTEHASLCKIEFIDPPRVPSWTQGCSATVIGENKLLTAAHCQESFGRTQTRVRCGQDVQWYQIQRWKANPGYRPKEHPVSNPHDIAVITLSSKVSGAVIGVESNTQEVERMILENRNCRHYGMGNRQDGSVGNLFVSQYQFPDQALGGRSFVERRFVMSEMIASNPERFMRSGDSGGPIICQNSRGHDIIVGVHSFISTSSSAALSATTSRSYDFIQSELKLNSSQQGL